MKTPRNPVINFWLGPVLWNCFGLFMSAEALFFPSFFSFMAVIGNRCEEEEFLGFSRKWALASIFPAQHEKAHITEDLHICQRFGAEWRGGQEKATLLHFKSSNSELGSFDINSWSSSSRADESWQLSIDGLFSGQHADITQDRKGNGKRRRPL